MPLQFELFEKFGLKRHVTYETSIRLKFPEKDPPLLSTNSLSPNDKCRLFSKPNDATNEFYTPMYPQKYPNNTECILKLKADFGYLIRVDFRDYFEIEPSNKCENDVLEIRDGPHGYSDVIGRFCGKEFPPIITSKDRYLWLNFTSDDTLEYRGFRAVFEFIKNTQLDRHEIEPCKFELGGVQGIISNENISQLHSNYSKLYSVPLDCTWIIRVKSEEKIYIYFETFTLREPNECDVNYVEIYGSGRDLRSRLGNFCGSIANPTLSTGNIVHFRFFARKRAFQSKFKAVYTAYRDKEVIQNPEDDDGPKRLPCEPHEYDCDDETCIDKSLRCNGVDNCRHRYDEEDGCNENQKGKFDISSGHIIIILTLGCGLLAGMCFAMCFNCIKKLVRDGRQIHENIRRSREQLEERRSTSIASSPRLTHRSHVTVTDDEEAYIEGKRNGHTCIHAEEDTEEEEEEEEEEEDEEGEESCVEMRDCECQTRDSLLAQRDSGLHGTPPPPPPPTRRPPGLPPLSPPLGVPTPPPPPVAHSSYYNRHHPPGDPYAPSYHHHLQHSTQPPPAPSEPHYGGDTSRGVEPPRQKHRSEGLILMKDRNPKYEVSKAGKTTPDVLVTH